MRNKQRRNTGILHKKFVLIFTFVLAVAISAAPFLPYQAQAATAPAPAATSAPANSVIFQKSVKEAVVSGLTHEKITRYTDDGWLSINILRADLKNPCIKVETMVNQTSIQKLTSIFDLAKPKKAVAAVNAGFFIWTDKPGLINPIGPIVDAGKMKTAYNDLNQLNDTMATFALGPLNEPLFDYWKTDISIGTAFGTKLEVGRYNRPYYGYIDLSVMDRGMSAYSVGSSSSVPDMVEAVIVNDVVTEIRQSMPSVAIPENGYILFSRGEGAQTILRNFMVGDTVYLDINTTPDWTKLKVAVSGGTILAKDGKQLASFTHVVDGRHPRTAIGSTKDGRYLIMVTVDGRQQGSIGMTQEELASLMLELGAYNAINMDGGGSTMMMSRKLGYSDSQIVNSPSDGWARQISTAVGIVANAPASALKGLIIENEDANVFVNTSRKLGIKGYDSYYNPVQIKPEQVKWSVSGVTGSFKDGVFYPKSVGEAKITATVGTISASIPISVLSSPVQLYLSANSITVPVNTKKQLTVKGKNKNGYYAPIYPTDVKWAIKGDSTVGTVSNGSFTAKKVGNVFIDASVGTTHAYCTASAVSYTTTVKDGFETNNGTFLPYPDSVIGSYAVDPTVKYSGAYSGKLTYDFNSNIENTRAAYFVYSNGGLKLNPNTVKIGLWVNNTRVNPCWLRAEIADAAGKKHLVDLSKDLSWTGWKYVEGSLEGIDKPSLLTRLYMVQPNPVPDAGEVYFDSLSVTEYNFVQVDPAKTPKDTIPADSAEKATIYKKTSTSFRFAVFGESREPSNDAEKKVLSNLANLVNKYIDVAALVGEGPHTAAKSMIKKPLLSTWTLYKPLNGNGSGSSNGSSAQTAYKVLDIKSSRLIQLDTGANGLRQSGKGQWQWLINQLESFKGSNVFIFTAKKPADFNDNLEAGLFQDILTAYRQKTGKNIWVFYKADKNMSHLERGIRYISTAGLDLNNGAVQGAKPSAIKYLLVTVYGSTVSFEFKPLN